VVAYQVVAYEVGATLLAAGGVALAGVGLLGLRQRLPRNRFAGVRTVNTLRDDHTFTVGNQVAAPLTIAAGAVALLGAVAGYAAPTRGQALTLMALAALGALAFTVAGGVLGDRVAKRIPPPTIGGCSGVCAGCTPIDGAAPASRENAPAEDPE
jgi:hypothetical protein